MIATNITYKQNVKSKKLSGDSLTTFFQHDFSKYKNTPKIDLPLWSLYQKPETNTNEIDFKQDVHIIISEFDLNKDLSEYIKKDDQQFNKIVLKTRAIFHEMTKDFTLLGLYITPSQVGIRVLIPIAEPINNVEEYKYNYLYYTTRLLECYDKEKIFNVDVSKATGSSFWFIPNDIDFIHFNINAVPEPKQFPIDVSLDTAEKKYFEVNKSVSQYVPQDKRAEIIMDHLRRYGQNLFDEFEDWKKFSLACKYENIDYKMYDAVCSQSGNYDTEKNHYAYSRMNPNGSLGMGTIFYYAMQIPGREKELKERLRELNNEYKCVHIQPNFKHDEKKNMTGEVIKDREDCRYYDQKTGRYLTNFIYYIIAKKHDVNSGQYYYTIKIESENNRPIIRENILGNEMNDVKKFIEIITGLGSFSFHTPYQKMHNLIKDYEDNTASKDLEVTELYNVIGYNKELNKYIFKKNQAYKNGKRYTGSHSFFKDIRDVYINAFADYNILKLHKDFQSVYGEYTPLLIGWCYATVYRHVIMKKFHFFPLMFLQGLSQSGKSTLASFINLIFGMNAYNILSMKGTTMSNLYTYMYRLSNLPLVIDEFRNSYANKDNIIDILRSAFNGEGRSKKDRDSRSTIEEPVNCSILIAGEERPDDMALSNRCIIINMNKIERSESNINNLKEHNESLSAFLDYFITRDLEPERMFKAIDSAKKHLKSKFKEEDEGYDERVLDCYTVALGFYNIFIEDVYETKKASSNINRFAFEEIKNVTEDVREIGSLSTFWKEFESLVSATDDREKLFHDVHYLIRDETDVNGNVDRIMYLWWHEVHARISQRLQRRGKPIFSSIKTDLASQNYCVSKMSSVRINSVTRACVGVKLEDVMKNYNIHVETM